MKPFSCFSLLFPARFGVRRLDDEACALACVSCLYEGQQHPAGQHGGTAAGDEWEGDAREGQNVNRAENVQRDLNHIFELLFLNFGKLPRHPVTRFQLAMQIRIQQMQTFISSHFAEQIGLSDIAASANISRSEANRCFNSYIGISPMEALLRHRLRVAQKLLLETGLPLREISCMCGFNSESYFSRCFRRMYDCSPGSFRSLRK